MSKVSVCILALVVFCSCRNGGNTTVKNNDSLISGGKYDIGDLLNIDTFSISSTDNANVMCYFYDVAISVSSAVFCSVGDSIGYLSVGGKLVDLRCVEIVKKKLSKNTDYYSKIYRNNLYELNIELMELGGIDGGNEFEGKMTLKNKKGEIASKNIKGSCVIADHS